MIFPAPVLVFVKPIMPAFAEAVFGVAKRDCIGRKSIMLPSESLYRLAVGAKRDRK